MTPISIRILELIRAQPAHKLPLIFTMESNPFPDCDESPEEVLEEVMKLGRDSLVEAFVVRNVTWKPLRLEVRYVTLIGRVAMDGRDSKLKEGGLFGKVIFFLLALILAEGILLFLLRHNNGGFSSGKAQDTKAATESPVSRSTEPIPIEPQPSQDANTSQTESVHGE